MINKLFNKNTKLKTFKYVFSSVSIKTRVRLNTYGRTGISSFKFTEKSANKKISFSPFLCPKTIIQRRALQKDRTR